MPKQILLATTNLGKIHEINVLLGSTSFKLLSLNEVGLNNLKIAETGKTFRANALIKAKVVAKLSLLPTIAEDSGLEVECLGKKPGIKSARYCDGTDSDRCQKLLKELQGANNRRARFITVVCYFDPQTKQSIFFQGKLSGQIALEPAGKTGFGYDPIFIPDGYKKTLAELGVKTKNQISHRFQAFQQLKEYFIKNLC